MLRGWVVTLIVVGLGATAHADAEPEGPPDFVKRALELAREGARTGDHGMLAEAIELFKRGYEINPHPVILCNIGQSYKVMERLPQAHMMLSQCLQRLPAVQPAAVDSFRPVLEEIEATLPTAHIAVDIVTSPEGARIGASVFGADETLPAPAVIWLPEGVHTITARYPEYAESRQEITITAQDIAGHPKKGVRIELRPEGEADVTPIVLPEPTPPSSGRRTAGWVALAGGVALLAGGGAMHAVAYDTRKELADGLSGAAYEQTVDKFHRQRAVTYGLYGVGAAATITGAVLLYLSPSGGRVSVEPAPAGDGATVWIDLSP